MAASAFIVPVQLILFPELSPLMVSLYAVSSPRQNIFSPICDYVQIAKINKGDNKEGITSSTIFPPLDRIG